MQSPHCSSVRSDGLPDRVSISPRVRRRTRSLVTVYRKEGVGGIDGRRVPAAVAMAPAFLMLSCRDFLFIQFLFMGELIAMR